MSTINLSKGNKIDLSKVASEAGHTLTKIRIGLGWDPINGETELDADVTVAFADASGKATVGNFCFYKNLKIGNFCTHHGDNRDGEGDGDDEVIDVDLSLVPEDVEKILIHVTIHEGGDGAPVVNKLNFGMTDSAYVRIVDMPNFDEGTTGEEMAKFDLEFDASATAAVLFGTLIRRNGSWYLSADNSPIDCAGKPSLQAVVDAVVVQ